ncbi:MAG: class I SAM-dependent methyltransferase [Planctomycetaceae bacterium]|nr:class I SAM-dependent methyltransferase [Planctomycetaceae bacterium]
MSTPIEGFFDGLSGEYAGAIERCFPRYREMLWAVLEYLPDNLPVRSILDLGCGTGNLSVLMAERYPEASLTVVDLSAESLEVCRRRVAPLTTLQVCEADFRALDYAPGAFDLIVSSIAVHHLELLEKRQLFQQIFGWLSPGGVFTFADQFRGVTRELYARHIENWHKLTQAAGSSEADWEMWMQHQRDHDHHDTLPEQIDLLRESGFDAVDCVWRYLLWGVVTATKAGSG